MKGERLHSPSMARFRAELLGCGSRGMRGEIFAQAGGDFGHGGVDILVNCASQLRPGDGIVAAQEAMQALAFGLLAARHQACFMSFS